MTKLAEIQQAIDALSPEEREELRQWMTEEVEVSPEELAAIDEGIRSAETEPLIPIAEVRKKIKEWATR